MPQPEFIAVGRVLAPWGIRGKLRVQVLTDFPQRFAPGSSVYVVRKPFTVETVEWQKGNAILKLGTVDSRRDAEQLIGETVEIERSQLEPLPEGQYYQWQIVGLEVWTVGGEKLGTVTAILSAAGNDNYVVRGARGEILIPAIADVVKSIDLERERITIEPMPGLLELNE